MPGHELRITGDRGDNLRDREVGRVLIRGPSLMSGYFRNQEATDAALSADGWLDTDDLGSTIDGQLVITGRSKDLIIRSEEHTTELQSLMRIPYAVFCLKQNRTMSHN